MKTNILIAASLIVLLALGCNNHKEEAKPQLDISKAAPYRILGKKTWTFMNAERGTIFIESPTLIGFEERAHTVMKAALDLGEQYKLDDTEVMLVPNERLMERGLHYARAVYRNDKAKLPNQDTWTVMSSDDVLSEKDLAMAELYLKNVDKFVTKEGYTDHDRLSGFIAKQMNVPIEDAGLPTIFTRPYEPKYRKP
jgi:uncharacterized lipoprotein NlpE involved in copper resistance